MMIAATWPLQRRLRAERRSPVLATFWNTAAAAGILRLLAPHRLPPICSPFSPTLATARARQPSFGALRH